MFLLPFDTAKYGGGYKMVTEFNRLTYKSEYTALANAGQRCANPNDSSYKDYGARGITVHSSWRGEGGFQRFMEHIGPKPSPELTLDRIDNDKGYEPNNVRWASRKEQLMNRRPCHSNPVDQDAVINLLNDGHTVLQICQSLLISRQTVYNIKKKIN